MFKSAPTAAQIRPMRRERISFALSLETEKCPNFTIVGNRNIKAYNWHYRKCKWLGLPFCVGKKKRVYAMFGVDFITTLYYMDQALGKAISDFFLSYWLSHPDKRIRRLRFLGGFMDLSRDRGEASHFVIFADDAHWVAEALMPLINDRRYWIPKPGIC